MKDFSLSFSSIALACTLAFSGSTFAKSQNEVNVGIADAKLVDDQFVSVGYTRYFSEVTPSDTPLSINPYLQRVNSLSVSFGGIDDLKQYDAQGNWFVNDKWLLTGGLSYSDIEYGSSKGARLGAGYFINNQWQVGTELNYSSFSYTIRINTFPTGEVQRFNSTGDEWTPSLFTRYTNITKGSGWDVLASYVFTDEGAATVSGNYFFNQQFSLGASYSYHDFGSGDGNQNVGINLDYWFTESASLQFGLGANVDDISETRTATLSGSYRF